MIDRNQMNILKFQDVSFTVKGKGGECKPILQKISHVTCTGKMVAILGPSGSGKTTLMNVLTLKAHYGRLIGEITLNDIPLDSKNFRKHCFHVQQFDKNWLHLTVNELLTYAHQLSSTTRRHADSDATSTAVDDAIESMGLSDVQHIYYSKLSGGQQRRLSLAIALLNKPSILFLDEVTSGLDSAASDNICEVLRKVATEKNLIVVCTIHQPSIKVYERFDQIILLSKGRLAYAGDRVDAESYFSSLGYPLLPRGNPAEHYLDLLNCNFGDEERLELILIKWEERTSTTMDSEVDLETGKYVGIKSTSNTLSSEMLDNPSSSHSNLFSLRTLLRRHFILIWRNPIPYFGRSIAFLITNSVFALVYWQAREYTQEQLMNKMWLIMWFMAVPTMMGVVAVVSLHDEITIITEEVRNGLVQPLDYLVVKFVLSFLIITIFVIVALGIPMFAIQNFDITKIFPVFCQWSLVVYVFESLAELLATLSKSATNGVLIFLSYWVLCFLFGGIFITPQSIYWPLKTFYHIMPFSYYTRSMMFIMFDTATFEACDQETSLLCFTNSTEGSEVLTEFQRVVPVIAEPNPWYDALYLVAMIGFFKTFYIFSYVFKMCRYSAPRHEI